MQSLRDVRYGDRGPLLALGCGMCATEMWCMGLCVCGTEMSMPRCGMSCEMGNALRWGIYCDGECTEMGNLLRWGMC
eukprot:1535266-Rhodomonas_salina.1